MSVPTRRVTDRTCVIKACEPTRRDGLLIEGIATTRGWGSYEKMQGKTYKQTRGLDPREMANDPPFPLLWRHDWAKRLGLMFRSYATRDALYFNALIAPPGAEGYDRDLLTQVWSDVRSGKAGAVSFANEGATTDGKPWKGVELSVCPKGANPFARITRAVFPDGFQLHADHPDVDEYVTRDASVKHHAKTPGWGRVQKEESPPMRYKGVWREGVTYQPGHVVTRSGLLWHANETTTAKPGTGPQFTMMFKDEEKR